MELPTPLQITIPMETSLLEPQNIFFSFRSDNPSSPVKAYPIPFPTDYTYENYDLVSQQPSPLSLATPRISACSSTTVYPTLKSLPIRQKTRPSAPKPNPCEANPLVLSSGNVAKAHQLHDSASWSQLRDYLSSHSFPSSEHSILQELYYSAIYSLNKLERGLRSLTPPQRYRLRKKFPLPSSISSVVYKSNKNHHSSQTELLESVFSENPAPSPEEEQMLSGKTGLTEKQIRNYFKNKRARSRK